MFPRAKITGVQNGRIKTGAVSATPAASYASKRSYSENQTQVSASIGGGLGGGGANSVSMNSFWSSQYQYMFTGLIPAEPMYNQMAQLALFYRDIYLNDSVGGTVVDLQSL